MRKLHTEVYLTGGSIADRGKTGLMRVGAHALLECSRGHDLGDEDYLFCAWQIEVGKKGQDVLRIGRKSFVGYTLMNQACGNTQLACNLRSPCG